MIKYIIFRLGVGALSVLAVLFLLSLLVGTIFAFAYFVETFQEKFLIVIGVFLLVGLAWSCGGDSYAVNDMRSKIKGWLHD